MYKYAILTDKGVCHTVIECSQERTDINDDYTVVDKHDVKYLNALWKGSEWEFPPTQGSRWNGTEWIDPNPIVEETE